MQSHAVQLSFSIHLSGLSFPHTPDWKQLGLHQHAKVAVPLFRLGLLQHHAGLWKYASALRANVGPFNPASIAIFLIDMAWI